MVAETGGDVIRCDACPVLCRIRAGKAGACDRYANLGGKLNRLDPLLVASRSNKLVPFMQGSQEWSGEMLKPEESFVTGFGSGTTYPDYKPAPFIVSAEVDGVDMVTVVSEGIFSYCGVKVKIDTDRYLGPEQAAVRAEGEPIGHVTTAEYGSQMLSLGGVRHFTGGSKREGSATCTALLAMCNGEAVELTVDEGSTIVVQAGQAPIVDGEQEARMRVGCGSAAMGMFAKQWFGHADEVIVVDDHITGVMTEHQAGRFLDIPPAGIRVRGRRSTPGRYFQVAGHGSGWGGTDVDDPLQIIERIDAKKAWPGLRLHMVSTTGEDAAWYVLDDDLKPVPGEMPAEIEKVVARIAENCEPALSTVLFMAGAGGSLRSGVTENPVRLTRSVKAALTRVTCGGAPVYIWPGGGITLMVDVTRMPKNAFGYVPTPALVAPIEFSLTRSDYAALGGHVEAIVGLDQVPGAGGKLRVDAWNDANPWPVDINR
ncbi:MAG: 6-hydroxynicotinate reductase [Rhodospirillaceae bacterium]|nr:6-hydroxynicotinate reductase [Rhodospirillaceae bacterium]